MTSQILFDRLAYGDRLKAASFTEQQARGAADALGEALTETVATKADIAQLDSKFSQVETRIAESRATIIQWVVGVAVAACTVGAAVAGLIIKHVP